MGLFKQVIRKRVRQPLRRAVRQRARRVSVECPKCHKRYANPLAHTCAVSTDFKRRKAAADRRKAAAAERRRRAREKRAAPARRPPARQAHDYRLCRDGECARHACRAYRDGLEDCPLEHVT